jgi:secreted trypsin-like serine protease
MMKANLPLSLVLWALVGAIVPCGAIIGGSTAVDERFPYFVSLADANGAHRCGGALIAPDMVLTAASCNAA